MFNTITIQHKGRGQRKKNVFFRALPESPKPPPPVYMQPKKQLKVQFIGIFEEIESFY